MLPLIVAAVSKTPFYIAGGVLAAYAVLLAALGILQPNFPGGKGGERLVIAVSFVLVVVTIAMSIHTSTFE